MGIFTGNYLICPNGFCKHDAMNGECKEHLHYKCKSCGMHHYSRAINPLFKCASCHNVSVYTRIELEAAGFDSTYLKNCKYDD